MFCFAKHLQMKNLFWAILLTIPCIADSQPVIPSPENIFIITTDGFRWQEVFNGADSALLFNPEYVKDTSTQSSLYWDPSPLERRKKLFPFLWSYVAKAGQLWGNRYYDNSVSVSNPYRFSYAGYNELFTGYPDPAIMRNRPKENRNDNLLAYLNSLPKYHNQVAVFGSWKLLSYILAESRNGLPVNCGYEPASADTLSIPEATVNFLQGNISEKEEATRLDLLTYTLANEYVRRKHPRIVYLSLGETDEFAHHRRYDRYLAMANQFDKILSELWQLVQEDEFYKNKTAFILTTDHGRGKRPDQWAVHGPFTRGSDETWLVQWGAGIESIGEVKQKAEIFTAELAQTIAGYLGEQFNASHPVSGLAYTLLPVQSR